MWKFFPRPLTAELGDGSLCTKLTTKEKRSEQTAGRTQSADLGLWEEADDFVRTHSS